MSHSVSVIVPCYNEAERIPSFFESLRIWCNAQPGESFEAVEIVFVNDASTDETALEIQNGIKCFEDSNLDTFSVSFQILNQETNQGKGAAVHKGDSAATFPTRCFLDADLSTPLEELTPALNSFESQNADLLIGSRHVPGSDLVEPQGLFRILLGRCFSIFTSVFHSNAFSDTQCGFKLWRESFSNQVLDESTPSRWSFDMEWIIRCEAKALRVVEHPVSWTNDDRSKVSPIRDGVQMLFDVVKYRVLFGSAWTLLLSLVMIALGLGMALNVSNDFFVYVRKAWEPMAMGSLEIYEPLKKSQGGYYYSPLFAILGVPFAWLIGFGGDGVGQFAYYLFYCILSLCALVLVKRVLRYSGWKLATSTLSGIVFLVFIMNNHYGQAISGNISAQVTALIVLSFYLYFYKYTKLSAFVLLLAVNFKVYPVFLGLYFLLLKDWKYLIWGTVFGLAFLVAPALFVGWEENLWLHQQQIQSLINYGPQNDFGRLPYQSFPAALIRLFRFLNVELGLSLSESLAMRIGQFSGVALAVLFAWRFGLKTAKQRSFYFFVLLAIMGLITPASWVAHSGFAYAPLVVLLIGFCLRRSPDENVTDTERKKVKLLFGSFVLLYCFTTQGVLGRPLNDLLEYWSIPTLGLCFLVFAAWKVGVLSFSQSNALDAK